MFVRFRRWSFGDLCFGQTFLHCLVRTATNRSRFHQHDVPHSCSTFSSANGSIVSAHRRRAYVAYGTCQTKTKHTKTNLRISHSQWVRFSLSSYSHQHASQSHGLRSHQHNVSRNRGIRKGTYSIQVEPQHGSHSSIQVQVQHSG